MSYLTTTSRLGKTSAINEDVVFNSEHVNLLLSTRSSIASVVAILVSSQCTKVVSLRHHSRIKCYQNDPNSYQEGIDKLSSVTPWQLAS
jgi:hypothetical protein